MGISYEVLKLFFKRLGTREMFGSKGDELVHEIKRVRKGINSEPNEKIKHMFDLQVRDYKGYPYYYMSPKVKHSDKYILYTHGGGCVLDITQTHWKQLSNFLEKTGATAVIPRYPLAPEHNCLETMEMLEVIYREMLETILPEKIIFAGDSAGGGISLSFAQYCKAKNIMQPKRLVLLSPMLSLADAEKEDYNLIREIEKRDFLLAYDAFPEIGKWWAGPIKDRKNYMVSPLYGDIKGLAKTYIYGSKEDVLYPYVRHLKKRSEEDRVDIEYHIKKDFCHCYMFLNIKEGKETVEEIVELFQ
ncbi:alpha/beta hydrolase fold domain-containing protein [Anaeromicropila populeti]|uniref:Acetyl esterase/lipase n=1 Tax=Anaeromicropila populeti TaxID=37658 RepID=A0A1I6HXF3_9FIRM|nr:alpha/beta hydrolase [Anaeromicropila populeti]SFR59078.1 Acetyl esterase/lipase [Anaeromicropila populeti]